MATRPDPDDDVDDHDVVYGTLVAGGDEYAIAASDLLEVVRRPPHLAAVPRAPPWLLGLHRLRDEVFPVVHLRSYVTGEAPVTGPDDRIAVLDCGAHLVGVLCDATGEILRMPPSSVRRFAGGLPTVVQGVLTPVGTDRLIQVLGRTSFVDAPRVPRAAASSDGDLDDTTRRVVVFTVGPIRFGVDLEQCLEVHVAAPVEPSFGYFLHCVGVVGVRGASVGVLDLRAALGLPPAETAPPRQIFLHDGATVIAIPVDDVLAVAEVPSRSIAEVSLIDRLPLGDAVSRHVRRGPGEDLTLLDVPRLFSRCAVNPDCPEGVGRGLLDGPDLSDDVLADAAYLVTFEVDGELCALEMTHVHTIRDAREVAAPPGPDRDIAGTTRLRDETVAVIDLRVDRTDGPESRIVVVEADGRRAGVRVDRLRDIRRSDEAEPVEVSDRLRAQLTGATAAVAKGLMRWPRNAGEPIVPVLDPVRLLAR